MRTPFPALLATLVSAALLAGCLHRPPRPPAPGLIDQEASGWRLTGRTDPFTRETLCRLQNRDGRHPDVNARAVALVFRFPRRVDTAEAWFRIDNGPPRRWSDLVPHLIDLGSMTEAERLDNPSGGRVAIPFTTLGRARLIVIRPARKTYPRLFDLEGAWPLLDRAEALHCRFP